MTGVCCEVQWSIRVTDVKFGQHLSENVVNTITQGVYLSLFYTYECRNPIEIGIGGSPKALAKNIH